MHSPARLPCPSPHSQAQRPTSRGRKRRWFWVGGWVCAGVRRVPDAACAMLLLRRWISSWAQARNKCVAHSPEAVQIAAEGIGVLMQAFGPPCSVRLPRTSGSRLLAQVRPGRVLWGALYPLAALSLPLVVAPGENVCVCMCTEGRQSDAATKVKMCVHVLSCMSVPTCGRRHSG